MSFNNSFINQNNANYQMMITDFQIISQLKTSSSSLTQKAIYIKNNSPYFIKQIPQQVFISNFSNYINYMREISILKDLENKHSHHFLKLCACFEDNNYKYIVYEGDDGITLEELRTEHQKKNEYIRQKIIINIFLQLLDILKILHENYSIIHMQIRPENIIVNPQENYSIKLVNFEQAAYLFHQDQSLVSSKPFIYSKFYTPPEFFNRQKDYDYKVDIYSLGLTMYNIMNPNDIEGKTNLPFYYINNQIKKNPNTNEFYDNWLMNFIETLYSLEPNSRPTASFAYNFLKSNQNNRTRFQPDIAIIKPNNKLNISTGINKNKNMNNIMNLDLSNTQNSISENLQAHTNIPILNHKNNNFNDSFFKNNNNNNNFNGNNNFNNNNNDFNNNINNKRNVISSNKNDMSNLLSLINLPILIKKYHEHPLINCLTPGRFTEENKEWICDICRKYYYYKVPSFYCINCDFDLCQTCFLNLVTEDIIVYNYDSKICYIEGRPINEKYLNKNVHFHPMLQIKRENTHIMAQMKCNNCTKIFEKNEIFYFCNLCNYSLCIECYKKINSNIVDKLDFIGPNSKSHSSIILQ